MNEKMKILVLTTTFPRWEHDTRPAFVYELSKKLQESGLEIVVLAPHCEGGKQFEILDGMKIYRYPYFFPTKYQKLVYNGGILPNIKKSNLAKVQIPFLLISQMFYTFKIVRQEKIEIIHSHWIIPNGLIGAICKILFNIPHITTAHAGDVFTIQKSGILRMVGSFVLSNAEIITANSTFTKKSILSINNSVNQRIQIIPMGVDEGRFCKIDRVRAEESSGSVQIILSIGRIVEKKGLIYLIMAMREVVDTYPSATLLIGGDGPEKENLIQLCHELDLERNVVFLGFVPAEKIAERYASSDVFILPSIETKNGDTEGLGVVLLEAMACGIPVIGSDIGGITDIIIDHKTGLLIRPGDPDDIAKKILLLLSDKELQKYLSRNALTLINKKFSWDIVSKQFFDIFQHSIVGKNRKS
jgi:glycosyltransferase involved in cell wall biosynthesis